jgi:hypothetical protein
VAEWSRDALDLRAREAKRSAFAETKRGWKITRERVANAFTAARNLTAKQLRRVCSVPARTQHEIRRWDDTRRKLDTYRAEWSVEREIARVVRGSDPIIVGPWLSEVGYEALYWIPFVRWIKATYHLDAERLVVVTRGGASAWYRDITDNAVEVFDLLSPEEFLDRNERRAAEGGGTVKQHSQSAMDDEIVAAAVRRKGLGSARVLHPLADVPPLQAVLAGAPPAVVSRAAHPVPDDRRARGGSSSASARVRRGQVLHRDIAAADAGKPSTAPVHRAQAG